jgi:hypothetical protein
MTFFWFFDLALLARTNLFIDAIEGMQADFEVVAMVEVLRKNLEISPRCVITL